VDENVNFLFRIIHRENFIEIFLQKWRWVFDKKRDEDFEGIFLFFVFDVVVSAPIALTVDEGSREVISEVVEVNFTRAVAVDERWV
jgi:hypothetical protein